MAILAYTDFTSSLNLDTESTDQQTYIGNMIDEFEPKYLRRVLGDSLYFDYTQNTGATKYTTLVNGETNNYYTDNGLNYPFYGLKEMLKYFIFFEIKKDSISYDNSVGENVLNNQMNETNLKLVKAFNKGVELADEAIDYINYKNSQTADTYPDFEPDRFKDIYYV